MTQIVFSSEFIYHIISRLDVCIGFEFCYMIGYFHLLSFTTHVVILVFHSSFPFIYVRERELTPTLCTAWS